MGHEKSGLTKEDRSSFLRARGFSLLRHGKGSHDTWLNEDFQKLVTAGKIKSLAGHGQRPEWELTVPANPTLYTWKSIARQAEDCANKVKEGSSRQDRAEKYRIIRENFNTEARAYKEWKDKIKKWYKAGLDIKQADEAPIAYKKAEKIEQIKNKMKRDLKGGL